MYFGETASLSDVLNLLSSYLTQKITFFEVVLGERFHSITGSVPVRHLEPQLEGGNSHIKISAGMFAENLNITPKGD